MKADILRRAEAISDLSSSSDDDNDTNLDARTSKFKKSKGRTVAYEEELDEGPGVGADGGAGTHLRVRVLGDGEESEGDDAEEDDDDDENEDEEREGKGEEERQSAVETILELAYIREPALFERDGQTRRGKGRVELRGATGAFGFPYVYLIICFGEGVIGSGADVFLSFVLAIGWSDEQIEGWKIMLERNVSSSIFRWGLTLNTLSISRRKIRSSKNTSLLGIGLLVL